MRAITMIIQSILARTGIVLAVVVLAFGAGWLRGHNRGWDGATAHYSAVVSAALAANAKDEAALAECKAANEDFAQAAASQAAQVAQAQAQMDAQQRASAEALGSAQRKLRGVEHANQDAHVWAAGIVPAVVADSLRQ